MVYDSHHDEPEGFHVQLAHILEDVLFELTAAARGKRMPLRTPAHQSACNSTDGRRQVRVQRPVLHTPENDGRVEKGTARERVEVIEKGAHMSQDEVPLQQDVSVEGRRQQLLLTVRRRGKKEIILSSDGGGVVGWGRVGSEPRAGRAQASLAAVDRVLGGSYRRGASLRWRPRLCAQLALRRHVDAEDA